MKLGPGRIRRRRWMQAAVFAGGALALLALGWMFAEVRRPAALLLPFPLVGLAHCWAPARAGGRACRRLAGHHLLAASLIGALAVAASAAISLLVRMPQPVITDEFSYLLAADTFAHGRLTNPTHPMWPHFEAPHVIHQPTYASKYPPAQGLVMALGQVAFGHPIVGVWLSAGLACGALTWMLAGWMPGRWALAGGMLAVVHHLTVLWSQSYWGGLVAVFGGALTLGAFGRIVRRPRARHGVVLGVGLAILANSRPYEGLVLIVPLLTALAIWLVKRPAPRARAPWSRVLLPLGAVLAVAGSGMLYYNFRVTGDPLTTPYLVHERAYATQPLFIFQASRPAPAYRHSRLRRDFGGGASRKPERTITGLAAMVGERADEQARQFFGSLLVVAGLALLLPLERSGWQHLALLSLGVFTVGIALPSWLWSHYAAPAVGLALIILLRPMRRASIWRPGRIALGRPLVQALWVFMVGALALGSWDVIRAWSTEKPGWSQTRAAILTSLGDGMAKHLVIVRYAPKHDVWVEWVYNAAEIDAAPVVWAQEMDAEANARLIRYFKDRRVWLLEPGQSTLQPYPAPPEPGSSPGAPAASSRG